ncbi:MAG: PorT family protein [Saprospiraceae bacterium]|nr:PorT family protein [Saprospiraceae bacterium]MCB0624692.1 PorT family protein [Saprospiraceae bacterium]MCB0683663.1 PorT family protein [Saprospiraceae bacterium]
MKTTKIIFAAVLALASAQLSAQVSFGIKAGWNFVNVKTPSIVSEVEQVPDFKTITTRQFGFVSELELNDHFALQGELLHTGKGFKLNENFDLELFGLPLPVGAVAVTKVHYLEMPLLAKAKFGNEVVEGYVVAGPTFGYAINGKVTTRAKVLVEVDLFDTKLDLDAIGYERFEVGGVLGAGMAFKAGNGKLFFDGRYTRGFTESYDVPLLSEKVQNKGFSLSAGYLYSF